MTGAIIPACFGTLNRPAQRSANDARAEAAVAVILANAGIHSHSASHPPQTVRYIAPILPCALVNPPPVSALLSLVTFVSFVSFVLNRSWPDHRRTPQQRSAPR